MTQRGGWGREGTYIYTELIHFTLVNVWVPNPGYGAGSHSAATQGLHDETETWSSQIKKINIFYRKKETN